MAEVILPGTYIDVRDEGLISAGRVISGYIGIVGTASQGPVGEVKILGSFTEAQETFGPSGAWYDGKRDELTLVRALEQIYNNGGRTVYAVRVDAGPGAAASGSFNDANGNPRMKLTAASPGQWGNAIAVVIEKRNVEAGEPLATVSKTFVRLVHGDVPEEYGWAGAEAFVKAVAERSRLVVAEKLGDADDLPPAPTPAPPDPSDDNPAPPPGPLLAGGVDRAGKEEYEAGLSLLENEIVNIVLVAGLDASNMGLAATLQGHLEQTAKIKRERIGLIGSNGSEQVPDIVASKGKLGHDRLIFVAPGLRATVSDPATRTSRDVTLPGSYTAAAVAGLIASLPVQASPTNKTLVVGGLSRQFSSSELEQLVLNNILAVERREGFRVVKGITISASPAWHQITTRRIVDYAIYGVRSACNPYIGKLNNERVRGAMKATLDAFLTRMVSDEALVGYTLEVSATRAQQIAGEVAVTMTLQPTFSIDFVRVTMYLG